METLTIEFQPSIKHKILELLNSFPSTELKFVENHADIAQDISEIERAYAKLKSGTAKMYSIEEVDAILDQTFSEYDR